LKGKTRIYLDTSIPNAMLDESKPERREETNSFWANIDQYEVFVSNLVVQEIEATLDLKLKEKLLELVKPFTVLPSQGVGIAELAETYMEAEIVPPNYFNDALHLAIASIHGIEVFVSWNYRHIVKVGTRRVVNSVNALHGYSVLEIVTPSML
jgi:predicted nucleic acid-binding protein